MQNKYKCRSCDYETSNNKETNIEPLCPTCCYNPYLQGKEERMEKVN